MSASNWAVCPRCKARRQRAADEAETRARAAYGTADVEEFDRLREEAVALLRAARSDDLSYETFREDYEIYGAEDGEVAVGYRGQCTTCGLTLSFEHRHPLPVGES